MNCDGCGKEIVLYYVIDNDLLLCADCFLEMYKQAIENMIGVAVVIREEG